LRCSGPSKLRESWTGRGVTVAVAVCNGTAGVVADAAVAAESGDCERPSVRTALGEGDSEADAAAATVPTGVADAGERMPALDDEGDAATGRGDPVWVGHASVGVASMETLLDGESVALDVPDGTELGERDGRTEDEATTDCERDAVAGTLLLQLGLVLAALLTDGVWAREEVTLAVSETETDGEALSDADEEALTEADAEADAEGEGAGDGDGGGRHSNRSTLFRYMSAVIRARPPPALSGLVSMAIPYGDPSRALSSGTPAASSRARLVLTLALPVLSPATTKIRPLAVISKSRGLPGNVGPSMMKRLRVSGLYCKPAGPFILASVAITLLPSAVLPPPAAAWMTPSEVTERTRFAAVSAIYRVRVYPTHSRAEISKLKLASSARPPSPRAEVLAGMPATRYTKPDASIRRTTKVDASDQKRLAVSGLKARAVG
jgi:hypothetical protein